MCGAGYNGPIEATSLVFQVLLGASVVSLVLFSKSGFFIFVNCIMTQT